MEHNKHFWQFTICFSSFDKQFKIQAVNKRKLIGVQDCSQTLKGSRGKDADGCKWVTEKYKVT